MRIGCKMQKTRLPKDQDWDVWFHWYQARLAGRTDPEAVELVYATVPQHLWSDPAAANAWIKEQLDRLREEQNRDDPAIEKFPPPEVPRQGPGPHVEIDAETGAIIPARPESLDAEGNNLARLNALHPQIRRLASELLGKIGQNEQPELFAAVDSYFSNVNRDLRARPRGA
jgi:hypothetical protein